MDLYNTFDAKTNLSKILAKVESGEEVLIGKSGKPVAKLSPYEQEEERQPDIWSNSNEFWLKED